MYRELGNLFGNLMIAAFAGTIFNYCVKYAHRRWGKILSGSVAGKRIMKFLMTVFVRHHRYFGFAAVLFLMLHTVIKFSIHGVNLTGAIAAVLIIIQMLIGIYAQIGKRPRAGLWFSAHRCIALLIIAGIVFHLIAPYALNR